MRAVDTNVLVRLLTRDEPRPFRAADRFTGKGGWVSHIVLVETTWVLSSVYDLKPAQIAQAIEMLLDHKDLALQSPNTVAAALSRFRDRLSTSFSDCLVLETARKAGHLPLGTFDRDLAKHPDTERL